MAKNTKNISQTVILPKNSHEKYLPLDTEPSYALNELGITNSGISNLKSGYEIIRPQPQTHVVLFITKGVMLYKDISKKTTEVEQGSKLVIPSKIFEHYWCEDDLDMFWFHLRDSEMWAELHRRGIDRSKSNWQEELLSSMQAYTAESNSKQPDSSQTARHYSSLIATYLRRELTGYSTTKRHTPQEEQLNIVLSAVEKDLPRSWKVEELARIIYASPSQLHRLCRSTYNSSPMQLVRERRLARAHDILQHTDYPLNVIADMVGYETPFALSKAFKSAYSISPSAMRKLSKETQL